MRRIPLVNIFPWVAAFVIFAAVISSAVFFRVTSVSDAYFEALSGYSEELCSGVSHAVFYARAYVSGGDAENLEMFRKKRSAVEVLINRRDDILPKNISRAEFAVADELSVSAKILLTRAENAVTLGEDTFSWPEVVRENMKFDETYDAFRAVIDGHKGEAAASRPIKVAAATVLFLLLGFCVLALGRKAAGETTLHAESAAVLRDFLSELADGNADTEPGNHPGMTEWMPLFSEAKRLRDSMRSFVADWKYISWEFTSGGKADFEISSVAGFRRDVLEEVRKLLAAAAVNSTVNAPVMFAALKDGSVVSANAAALNTLNLRPGDKIADCFAERGAFEDALKLKDNGMTAELRRCGERGSGFYCRVFLGDVFWAVKTEAGGDGAFVSALRGLPAAVSMTELGTGAILFANDAYRDMFSVHPASDLTGYPESTLYADSVTRSEVFTGERPMYTHDGVLKHVETYCGRARFEGRDAKISVVFDVSAERERLKKVEAEASERAIQSEMRARFVMDTSIVCRTHMNTVIGLSNPELLKTPNRSMEIIHDAALELMPVFDDLTDYHRIEAFGADVRENDFNLSDIIKSASELLTKCPERVRPKVYAAPDTPYMLIGDRRCVWQILRNLLDNAVKFTREGEIHLRVEPDGAENNKRFLKFTVRDTGPGISPRVRRRLFTPYAHNENPDKNPAHTGLGLAISKRLTDALGGTITCESEFGEGTSFTVRLPFTVSDPSAVMSGFSAAASERRPAYVRSEFSGREILLVEDNELNREVAVGLLNMLGVEPECAENGDEAVKLAGERQFDLIFMDILMPVMDGVKATRLIRESGEFGANVPIIALTANVFGSSLDEFKAAGMTDVLPKPVDFNRMREFLVKYTSHKGETLQ